jgi:cysteine-rich repeat protein
MSQDGARVRIGVYRHSGFPCASMNAAEGVGLDVQHSRPVGQSGEGGRLNSGYVDTSSQSIFKTAKIYIARKLPRTRMLRRDAYLQFGDKNSYLKQDVLNEIHSSLPNGVKGGSYHYTFSFFYRFRRNYYWNPGWEHRNIFRYGSGNREFLPAINWRGCYRHSGWSPRIYWNYNQHGCRRLDFVVSTTRVTGGNEDYYSNYNGESYITLTLGKWHHVAMSCNKHSCTTFIDGNVHTVYTIPPGDSAGQDVTIKVARERLLYIAQRRDYSGSQVYDFRSYNNVALSQNEISKLKKLYPPSSCGDGVRVPGEECDDGNIVSGDGCSWKCTIEPGYICRGGNTTYVAADSCNLGSWTLNINFENTNYPGGTANVDITTYNAAQWRLNAAIPLLYEHIGSDGDVTTRRNGNVYVAVEKKYAYSGNKGMRLHFRDYFYTSEYKPSSTEITDFESNPVVTDDPTLQAHGDWVDITSSSSNGNNGQTTTKLTSTSGDDGWVHGPWGYQNSDGTSTKRLGRTYNNIPSHSLVRVQMRVWLHGSICGSNSHVAIDISGDTIFAHTKSGNGVDEKFCDSLSDGTIYGTAYVKPTQNAQTPSTTEGYLALIYWKPVTGKIPFCDGTPAQSWCTGNPHTWRTYHVDVTVPHSDSSIELNVRPIFSSGCGTDTAFAFDQYKLQYSDITPNPFRPYNFGQLRNRNRQSTDIHSWIQLDTPNFVTQTSFLSFAFKVVKISRVGRQFIINLIDLDHAKTTFKHGNCISTSNCGGTNGCTACRPDNIYYRVCYWNQMSASGVSGCDESHFPTYNAWHNEVISPIEKLASIYDVATAYKPRKLRIQFLSFGAGQSSGGSDSEMDLFLDDIKIGTSTQYSEPRGCGKIEVSSNTADGASSASFKVDGVSLTTTQPLVGNGFCRIHIKYNEKPTTSLTVTCTTTAAFTTFINSGTVEANDRVFVASYGRGVVCDASCLTALTAIGGVGVIWKEGSSMVLMGRLGAAIGSLPMRLDHLDEGRVTASNIIHCPDVITSTSESSSQYFPIGPSLGLLDPSNPVDAKFVIKPGSSGGYVGCYRDKYSSGNMLRADMWFANNFGSDSITPATCAWMCREKGFTLSSNDHHSYHCRCGDKFGSYTCDSHGHCGLPKLEDRMCHHSCLYSDRLQKCGGHYYHPRSIAIYRTTGEKYVLPTEMETPVCDSSESSSYPCARVYDGRNDQDWRSTEDSYGTAPKASTITLQLKEKKLISAVRILWSVSGDNSRAKTMDISVKATSGGDYTKIFTTTASSESNYQLIRLPTTEALYVQIKFTSAAATGSKYILREIWLNYYKSVVHEKVSSVLSSSKLLSPSNTFSRNKIAGNLTMMQGGPQFFVTDYFQVIETTGQVSLNNLLLDYEAVTSYSIVVAAYSNGYDSGK